MGGCVSTPHKSMQGSSKYWENSPLQFCHWAWRPVTWWRRKEWPPHQRTIPRSYYWSELGRYIPGKTFYLGCSVKLIHLGRLLWQIISPDLKKALLSIGMAYFKRRHLGLMVYHQVISPFFNVSCTKLTKWTVSQCPIAPGSSFTYTFRADSYGTSWYHSHYSAQYADGLLGAMIIHGPAHAHYDHDLGPIMLVSDIPCEKWVLKLTQIVWP